MTEENRDFTNTPPESGGQQTPEQAPVYYEDEVVIMPDEGPASEAAQPSASATPAAQQKKPWNRRIVFAALAAVLTVALLVVAIIAAAGSSPLKLVADATENTLSTLGQGKLLTTAREVLSGGSISVEAPMNDLGQALFYGYGDLFATDGTGDGTLSVKTYADLPEQKMAVLVQLPFMNETLEAGVYGNQESVAVEAPALLPSVCGVNLKTLAEVLPQSVFAPDSGSSVALDEATFEQLMQSVAQLDGEQDKQNQAFVKQLEKLDRKVTAELFKRVEAYTEIEKDSGEVQFMNTSAKVNVVSIRADGPALAKIYREMLQWMTESKDVERVVNSFSALYGEEITAQKLPERFYDGLYDQLDACVDLEDEWEDVELALDFHITKSGKRLVKLEAEIADVYGDETTLVVTAGPTLADPELIQVHYSDAWQDMELLYGVERSDAKQYSARLRVKQNSRTVADASLSWDKKDGDVRLKYEDEQEAVLLKGSMLWEKKTLTANVRSITYDEDIIKPNLTISVCTDDKTPEEPEYTEVLRMSEADIETLGTQIEQNLQKLMGLGG